MGTNDKFGITGRSNMGMVLITSGKYAKNGYLLKNTNQKIYSIEELCYYIKKSPQICEDYLYDKGLANYIKNELELKERGRMLEELIERNAPLKDLMIVCFCSCNYFTKEEIDDFIQEQLKVDSKATWLKIKNKADSYLNYENYRDAIVNYQVLLKEKDFYHISSQVLGDIYHNLAVALLHTEGFALATDYFREAYERNNREESLKQYLLALRFSGDTIMYESALNIYEISEQTKKWLNAAFFQTEVEIYEVSAFNQLNVLRDLLRSDKMNEFYTYASQITEQMKEQYRIYNK